MPTKTKNTGKRPYGVTPVVRSAFKAWMDGIPFATLANTLGLTQRARSAFKALGGVTKWKQLKQKRDAEVAKKIRKIA